MGSDSHLTATAATTAIGRNTASAAGADDAAGTAREAIDLPFGRAAYSLDRARLLDDINALELRLALIDDRFERFASRGDDQYQAWRRDTVAKARDLAVRARSLETDGLIEAHHRRRVAAVLVTIRARIVALDERRAALRDRRPRAVPHPGGGSGL
ncbi:hypothetical protein [Agromyces salentinus]|uniref:Uncharacterized protein n=1 Tax=Agromyces salentinus TaxID=269421 RepID=A0ABP4YT74_9MICO|nr:hypothetical protein [Agromyces salentinus]